jgi:hypothetical protein
MDFDHVPLLFTVEMNNREFVYNFSIDMKNVKYYK